MKISLIVFYTLLCSFLSGNAYAQEPKTKKEILVSISSGYYKNATQVIEGFLKQAQISDFFIDERIEKIERKNFQFKNKTVDQTVNLLSQFYSIEFKFTEKKDFVTVILKEKKP
jgi:RNA binding exosome subunit